MTPFWFCNHSLGEDVTRAMTHLKISMHDDESEWDVVDWSQSSLSQIPKDVSDITVVRSFDYLQGLIGIASMVLFGTDLQRHCYRMSMCRRIYRQCSLLFEKLIHLHAENKGSCRQRLRSIRVVCQYVMLRLAIHWMQL